MAEKRPSYQWFPGDFKRDTALSACSFEARALWREMLDLMHDGEPYGHLSAGGVPISPTELARIVGKDVRFVQRNLAELRQRTVFSTTEDGCIYARRMVRDEAIRTARAEGGKRSLDNPNVPRAKSKAHSGEDIQKDILPDHPLPPSSGGSSGGSPASASASASAYKKKKEEITSLVEGPTARADGLASQPGAEQTEGGKKLLDSVLGGEPNGRMRRGKGLAPVAVAASPPVRPPVDVDEGELQRKKADLERRKAELDASRRSVTRRDPPPEGA